VGARRLLAAYARSEDLVRIGAYKAGADAELDAALRARPALRSYCAQGVAEQQKLQESIEALLRLEL
jgi:flagellum-specific ATP synthase